MLSTRWGRLALICAGLGPRRRRLSPVIPRLLLHPVASCVSSSPLPPLDAVLNDSIGAPEGKGRHGKTLRVPLRRGEAVQHFGLGRDRVSTQNTRFGGPRPRLRFV